MTWKYSNYSKINLEAAGHFPFSEARQYQLETISEIREAIDKGYKYIVLEAGTGTGKSAIAATLAQMFDSSYILTITKQLQDQYLRDFKDLGFKLVKGRSNFQCKKYLEDGLSQSCDLGRCVVEGYACKYSLKNHAPEKITKENTCSYYYQKFLAMMADVAIANYPYMFLELNYVEDFLSRSIMICDEAHNIENMIMNQLTLEFERKDLKEYLKLNLSKECVDQLSTGDYNDWISFVLKIKKAYEKELSKIRDIERPELSEKKIFIKNKINDCKRFLANLEFDPKMWIFDYDRDFEIAQFKPLKIDNYAKNTLFKYADVCLFMSATILDYRLFAHWLGISPDEIYAIRRKSPFDIKRNPIKTYSEFNMSRNHIAESAPKTIDTLNEILEKHKNDKGIIHTVSSRCRDFIIDEISSDRFIYHDTQNRADVIEEFKKSQNPLVLVSPSVGEGVDLPGDECRFQIIYKIPYPDLGDKQTAIRNAFDSKWYNYKTSLALVQTHGRGMRFEDDYCTTYFIDNRLAGFVSQDSQDNHFIPDTFRDAIDSFAPKDDKASEDAEDILTKLDFKKMVDLKYEYIRKGENLLKSDETENAIKFYSGLLSNELFEHDYYPYLKLAEAYEKAFMFEQETETIVKFLKSGIYATKNTLNDYKRRLKLLDNMGYFDYDEDMMELEREFLQNRKIGKVNLVGSPPLSVKIIQMKRDSRKRPSKSTLDAIYLDSVMKVDENLTYDEKIDLKRDLIIEGERYISKKQYGNAREFYKRLLGHELFVNDYYPYKKLSFIYRKDGQFEDDERILKEFFKSGIYCNDKQLAWFKNRFKLLGRMGVFNPEEMYGLESEFFSNGARNQSLANNPVPQAERINLNYQKKR